MPVKGAMRSIWFVLSESRSQFFSAASVASSVLMKTRFTSNTMPPYRKISFSSACARAAGGRARGKKKRRRGAEQL